MNLATIIASADVRALKGAPLAILWLCLKDPQPHSAAWYERETGYSDKPITQALRYLTEKGYMLKVPNGWMLTIGNQPALPINPQKLSTVYPQLEDLNRNNSDSTPLVVSSPLKDSKDLKDLTTTREISNRKNSDSTFEENLQACFENNIHDPAASEIAQMDHVTPEYILQHVEDVLEDENATSGAAIHRIKNGWTPKKRKETGREKYIQGPYAEFVD